jgi:hypothetical protein
MNSKGYGRKYISGKPKSEYDSPRLDRNPRPPECKVGVLQIPPRIRYANFIIYAIKQIACVDTVSRRNVTRSDTARLNSFRRMAFPNAFLVSLPASLALMLAYF